MKKSRLAMTLSGVAGEYFVAAELSRRGYVASLTLRNTRGIDILASNSDATKSVAIQVKSKQGTKAEWILTEKVERDTAEKLCFVFVRMNHLGTPQYHIVPRKVVSSFVKRNHIEWIKGTRRDGSPRRDTAIRKFSDPENKYLDKWDTLGLD